MKILHFETAVEGSKSDSKIPTCFLCCILFIISVFFCKVREKRRKSEFFKTENPTETRNRRHSIGGFTPFYPLVDVGAFSYPLQAAAVFHFTQTVSARQFLHHISTNTSKPFLIFCVNCKRSKPLLQEWCCRFHQYQGCEATPIT
jgi:hypothetical protein